MAPRLLLLSLAVGFVDAVAFVHFGAFPANMTGNSVLLALSLARLDVPGLTLAGLALLGFIVGAAAGARLVPAADHAWSRRTNLVLRLAAGLLVAANLALALILGGGGGGGDGGHFSSALLVGVAVAMGLQSAAIQRLAIPGVATVFVTGTLTTAVSRLAGLAGAAFAPAARRDTSAGKPSSPSPAPWLPAWSWASYFAGALLGGLQTRSPYPLLLVLPGLVLAGVAFTPPPPSSPSPSQKPPVS